ncbi:MAG: putative endonuclease [Fusobacteriaceae bacterium]|jgi:putative endonuclease|nr:putative endonuclease [Fusobacteriaceae bacterium]
MNKREIGQKYEEISLKYLEDKGVKILEKNYYGRGYEIDIIGKDNKNIIFFEIKYRKNQKYGYAEESVDYKKKKRMIKGAINYLIRNNLQNKLIRFDIIAINDNKINWIKDAFWGDDIGI